MKWNAPAAALVVALAFVGCQGGSAGEPAKRPPPQKPAVTDEYKYDITRLCDAVHLSGADQVHDDGRITMIAMWLGPNIRTAEGHDFLVAIQPLTGLAKAKALDDEAHRVGLTGCALSAEWRK